MMINNTSDNRNSVLFFFKCVFVFLILLSNFQLYAQGLQKDSLERIAKKEIQVQQINSAEDRLRLQISRRIEGTRDNPNLIRSNFRQHTFDDATFQPYFSEIEINKLLPIRWIIYRAFKENQIDMVNKYSEIDNGYLLNHALGLRNQSIEWKKKLQTGDSLLNLVLTCDLQLFLPKYLEYLEKYYSGDTSVLMKEVRNEKDFISLEITNVNSSLKQINLHISKIENTILTRWGQWKGKEVTLFDVCVFGCYPPNELYSSDIIESQYSSDSPIYKLLVKPDGQYSGGDKKVSYLDENYFEKIYSTARHTNDPQFKSQMYCGSFKNEEHYSRDRDAFVALVDPFDSMLEGKVENIVDLGFKYNEHSLNDYASCIQRDKQGNGIVAIWSDYTGSELHHENHVVKLDSLGAIKWTMQVDKSGFPHALTTDIKGDVYVLYNRSGTQFDINTRYSLIKVAGQTGKVIWTKEDICNGVIGFACGLVSDGENIYAAFNFRNFWGSQVKAIPFSDKQFNICLSKYSVDGNQIYVKTVLTEEPRLINQMKISDKGILCTGRKGNYDLTRGIDPIKYKYLTMEYGEYENENEHHLPFYIIYDFNGNVVKSNE